ncbi:hypothetical protein CDAR_43561 [Caerostris darwini]|uniref:Uncharacterized protein n=1 Tax=Caerostris darwini TaxID=1538125 RepID=A0AAV4WI91_9ARAC|nr:hypothetical protein CDAR_43561 [Caerostris darwini]
MELAALLEQKVFALVNDLDLSEMKLITDKAESLTGAESSALVNGVGLDVCYISYLKKLIVDGAGYFTDLELVDDLDLHSKLCWVFIFSLPF